MALFSHLVPSEALGTVQGVDTYKISIRVNYLAQLAQVRVGRLITIQGRDANEWLVGIVTKIWKDPIKSTENENDVSSFIEADYIQSSDNVIECVLVGTYSALHGKKTNYFTRGLLSLPDIDQEAYRIEGKSLENLMGIISSLNTKGAEGLLTLGNYSLERRAKANVDADKLFQRHVAILGSTGSGKSWAVANILEQISKLDCPNTILFDIHGEYKNLPYADQIRIAGPADIGEHTDDSVLYLPYWLLSLEDIQAVFVDRSEQNAPNQNALLLNTIANLKTTSLAREKSADYKASIDSPIPFGLDDLLAELSRIDKEKVPGAGTNMVNGPYYGQLTRLIMRLESKIADRRFGFLLQPPNDYLQYNALHKLVLKLAGYKGVKDYNGKGIKVIDFSEVPSEVLPLMVSLVARLVCQVQFWLDTGKDKDPTDRHPILFICDEAHTYLPSSLRELAGMERRALESFEKIAKEGRKYGIGLMIVSQRPSDVSSTILSQCNNIIALRLTNEKDRAVVRGLLSDSLDGLLSVLPGLEVGEAIVVGDAVLLPSRIQLAKPTYEPQSGSLDFWGCWKKSVTAHDIVAAAEAMRRQKRIVAQPTAEVAPVATTPAKKSSKPK